MHKHAFTLAVLLVIPAQQGCHLLTAFPLWSGHGPPLPPQVYETPPTAEDIVSAINTHSSRVQDVQGQGRLSVKGLPSLSAELAMQPHASRSRLRAELFGLTGTEVDLGSNADMFWVWVKRAEPPGVYFAKHEEFVASDASRMIPIQPKWLTEAFGILKLDPYKSYEGPFTAANGGLELRWLEHNSNDTIERRIVVHQDYGYIVKQEWLRGGNAIATATASGFKYWPEEKISLPTQLNVTVPQADMTVILEMDNYSINRPIGDPERLYQPPSPSGVPKINIAAPQGNLAESPHQHGRRIAAAPPYGTPSPQQYPPQNSSFSQQTQENLGTDRSSYWQFGGPSGNDVGASEDTYASQPNNSPGTYQPMVRSASTQNGNGPAVQIGEGDSFSPPTAAKVRNR